MGWVIEGEINMKNKCKTCKWFDADDDPFEFYGKCRRFLPTWRGNCVEYPRVSIEEIACGEYILKREKENETQS